MVVDIVAFLLAENARQPFSEVIDKGVAVCYNGERLEPAFELEKPLHLLDVPKDACEESKCLSFVEDSAVLREQVKKFEHHCEFLHEDQFS